MRINSVRLTSYHDSVPSRAEQLLALDAHCKRQEDRVLAFFRAFPDAAFSREQIERQFELPTQSASRVLANLSARYAIEKTDHHVTSSYGRRARTWRLARPPVGTQGKLL